MSPQPPNPSTLLARGVIDSLIEHGVTELVIAPGSRNAPLSFAAWDAARRGQVRLHTRFDERTAAFLALGMSKVGAPAAVICTSGTAVAHCHPAVMEAAHAGVPMIVISADRPAELRGTGASQTTDQVEIFGQMATFLDLPASGHKNQHERPEIPHREARKTASSELEPEFLASRTGISGRSSGSLRPLHEALGGLLSGLRRRTPSPLPLHLNVQFTPPLTPDVPYRANRRASTATASTETASAELVPEAEPAAEAHLLPLGPLTVVVAGDDAGPPARVLAQRAGWPLFAEPTAGCRTGDNALRCYRLLLDPDTHELARRIERVVVAGHPTLSRPVMALLQRDDVEVISMRSRGIWSRRPFEVAGEYDALDVEKHIQPADPIESGSTGWLDDWVAADREAARRLDGFLDDHLATSGEVTPWHVAGAVAAAVPPTGLLLVGASSPIRDLDLMVHGYRVGDRRKLIANRGVAGIDGTISTAIGAALARPHGERNLALMGDVTFLHDANALIIGPDQPTPDLTIVVVNDDGGSIFTMLEQGAERFADSYDQLFGTPHGVDIAALCAASRTPHWRVESLPELQQALASPNGGIEVVEVRCRRDNRRELDAAIRELMQP